MTQRLSPEDAAYFAAELRLHHIAEVYCLESGVGAQRAFKDVRALMRAGTEDHIVALENARMIQRAEILVDCLDAMPRSEEVPLGWSDL